MSLEQNDIDRMVQTYREDFTPDVERGLRQLHGRLTPVRQLTPRARRWPRLAAAAAVALLVIASLFLFRDQRVTLTTDGQALAEHVLPDGSTVVLQEGSRLSYDADAFNIDDRQLVLEGQAFFDVAHDAGRPFVVSHGNSAVRVTGTAFNLRAAGSEMEVEVSEGTVVLQHAGSEVPVAAHRAAHVTRAGDIAQEAAPNLNHQAWRTGILTFDHTPIDEVLTFFRDNWGVECGWADGTTCDYAVSGSFRGTDVPSVLSDIAQLGGLELRSTGDDATPFELSGPCSK